MNGGILDQPVGLLDRQPSHPLLSGRRAIYYRPRAPTAPRGMMQDSRGRRVELAIAGRVLCAWKQFARAAVERILIDARQRHRAKMANDRLQKTTRSAAILQVAQRRLCEGCSGTTT